MNNKLKVGDFITSYWPGIYRLVKIIAREDQSPLVVIEKVFDKKMNPRKGNNECDISYCKKITAEQLDTELNLIIDRYKFAISVISKQS